MKLKVKRTAYGWTVENAPISNQAQTWEGAFLYALNASCDYKLDQIWDGHPIQIGTQTIRSGSYVGK